MRGMWLLQSLRSSEGNMLGKQAQRANPTPPLTPLCPFLQETPPPQTARGLEATQELPMTAQPHGHPCSNPARPGLALSSPSCLAPAQWRGMRHLWRPQCLCTPFPRQLWQPAGTVGLCQRLQQGWAWRRQP